MTEVSANQLRKAVQEQHGGKATLSGIVWVDEKPDRAPVWHGMVHVFDLAGHPEAKRAYAWSVESDDGTRRFYAVLHLGPVSGPADAVHAASLREQHSPRS